MDGAKIEAFYRNDRKRFGRLETLDDVFSGMTLLIDLDAPSGIRRCHVVHVRSGHVEDDAVFVTGGRVTSYALSDDGEVLRIGRAHSYALNEDRPYPIMGAELASGKVHWIP